MEEGENGPKSLVQPEVPGVTYELLEQPALSAAAAGMMRALADTSPAYLTLGSPKKIEKYEEGVVAKDGAAVVGVAGIYADKDLERAEIGGVYVIPNEGGKYRKSRIGFSLLEKAIERCRAREIPEIMMASVTTQGAGLVKTLLAARPDLAPHIKWRDYSADEGLQGLSRIVEDEK